MTKDEIRARLTDAAKKNEETPNADGLCQWLPRKAIIDLADEVAAILAEQQAQIESLKAEAAHLRCRGDAP